jgi:hypothetical protein
LIQPQVPEVDERGKRVGKRHYRVNFTMVVKVVDRDLRCKSPYTTLSVGFGNTKIQTYPLIGYAIYDGQVMQKCRINIAPAFRPGVK